MSDTSPLKFKPDPDFDEARDNAFAVTAAELRQFIEQYERLEAERSEIMELQKDVMAQAKSRGYHTKVIRKLVAERKRDRDDVVEEQAIMDLYREALGI
jgi:uncharacterized protein (UPF0335 family)